MTAPTRPSVRPMLERLPAETEALRQIRFAPDDQFDDLTDDDLGLAYRWLTAARYSLNESIRKIERILARRPAPEETCSPSNQRTTATEASVPPSASRSMTDTSL